MYQWGKTFMPILVVAGSSTAIAVFFKTKEKAWLLGGATLFSIMPYTLLGMKKTNNCLNAILKESCEADVEEDKKGTVINALKKWVKLHRVRGILALGSAAVFFLARQYTKGSA